MPTTNLFVRTIHDLVAIQSCWERWQNHPNSDFAHFQLVCSLRREVVCPHVIIVENGGQPCALLAARMEQTHIFPSIGYFQLARIPAKVLTIVNQGVLGQMDDEIGKMVVQHLWSLLSTGDADVVAFHQMPEHSPLMRALLENSPGLWCEKKPKWSAHWVMDLPELEGFLLKKLRSKHRAWIRRKQRELESAFSGKVAWRWMRSFVDLHGLCAQLEKVAGCTYQRGLGAGFIDNDENRQRLSLFAGRGQLRVQVLEIEGQIKAFWIGTVYNGVFHSSSTGYDPELSRYEPGTLVFLQVTEGLVREGVRKLDFGLGDAHYKRRFGDQCWREATLRLFAPTAKGLALRSTLAGVGMLNGITHTIVQKAGLVDRLKTIWRRRLAVKNQRKS